LRHHPGRSPNFETGSSHTEPGVITRPSLTVLIPLHLMTRSFRASIFIDGVLCSVQGQITNAALPLALEAAFRNQEQILDRGMDRERRLHLEMAGHRL